MSLILMKWKELQPTWLVIQDGKGKWCLEDETTTVNRMRGTKYVDNELRFVQ